MTLSRTPEITEVKRGFVCFACDRPLIGTRVSEATTRDGQDVFVGGDCYRKIEAAGADGYRPPKGGPRLFPRYPEGQS